MTELTYRPLRDDEKNIIGFTPTHFEAMGAISCTTGSFVVAIKLYPGPDHPVYKDPVVVMLPDATIDNFVKSILFAQSAVPESIRKGGST
jgi:hypothetical protein